MLRDAQRRREGKKLAFWASLLFGAKKSSGVLAGRRKLLGLGCKAKRELSIARRALRGDSLASLASFTSQSLAGGALGIEVEESDKEWS